MKILILIVISFHQTIEISEYLKSKNISGIFYILGEVAEYYPELVKKIFKDNHTIGLQIQS